MDNNKIEASLAEKISEIESLKESNPKEYLLQINQLNTLMATYKERLQGLITKLEK